MNVDGGTITTVLAVLLPAGTALASYVTLRERVSRHDRSLENFGARFEAQKEQQAKDHAYVLAQLAQLDRVQAVDRAELSRPMTIRDPAAPR
jgi:hypothetical protein